MYVRGVRGRVGIAAEVALYKKRKKNYKIRIIRNRSKTRRPISLPVQPVGKFAELLSAPYADLKGIRLESAATRPKPFQLSAYYSFTATQS